MTAWPYPSNHYIGTPKARSEFVHSDGEPVTLVRRALGYDGDGPFNSDDAAVVSAWHRSRGGGDRSTITEADWNILVTSARLVEPEPEPEPEPEKKTPRKRAAKKAAAKKEDSDA